MLHFFFMLGFSRFLFNFQFILLLKFLIMKKAAITKNSLVLE